MTAPHQSATESAEPAIEARRNMLFQVAAAVAIAAGLVFITAVIFFSGVMAGRASSSFGPSGHGEKSGSCPMMRGGMMRGDDDEMVPGRMMRPGDMLSPTPTPTTAAPGGTRP